MRTRFIALFTALAIGAVFAVANAPTSSAGVSGIPFGALVQVRGAETFAQAVARQDAAYGTPTPMPISRVFYSGAPQAWPGNAGMSGRPVVVSFRYRPLDVIAGKYDTALRNWFAGMPSYPVYWSYSHEPEDNIERGEFTAADYRAAWQRISDIANASAPPTAQLHSVLILMCWSLRSAANRNWHDYYVPGAQSMLAFDCYNHVGKTNQYGDPANVFKGITIFHTERPDIPWGVAEIGSTKATTDVDGSQRAAWLHRIADWLVARHAEDPAVNAQFALYFDIQGPKGTEYRLLDAKSKEAWRDIVQNY
jgi:hypothetical protein